MSAIEGGLRLHCRCADDRVLTHLLPVLVPAQALRVAQSLDSWWWMDATSSIQRWHGEALSAPAGIEADAQDQLQLSDAQFQRMMALGEPDIMFTLLMDKTSELEPGSGRGAFRARLQRILATASQLTVAQTPDRLQFVVLSLACGENFHAHPGLQATWRNIRERGAQLEQAMGSWSEDLWVEIDNGRRPAQ